MIEADRVSYDPAHDRRWTVTYRKSVIWWKRPWCWIRRKPTKFEQTFKDVEILNTTLAFDDKGGMMMSVDMEVPSELQTIRVISRVSDDLRLS